MTLIEILITIVLLGLSVGATLTLLTTTIRATTVTRDHANAHAWLQTAADVLYARAPENCTDMATMAAGYETTIQQTDNPEGWPSTNINVLGVEVFHRTVNPDGTQDIGWGTVCSVAASVELHRLLIEVRAVDGSIVEQVEVILSDD